MEYKQITLTEIYIPICFYFNTIRFFTCIICTNIYIPICFYFNKKCKKLLIISTKSFTFQYVSILIIVAVLFPIFCKNIYIPICFYFNSKGTTEYSIGARKFTFQYVSILMSRPAFVLPPSFSNLHSNMFLF